MNETLKKIQDFLPGGSAALVLTDANCFYLTKFSCDNGIVFITKQSAVFFTDSRYIEQAKSTSVLPVKNITDYVKQINKICQNEKVDNIYTEVSFISLARFKTLSDNLDSHLSEESHFDDFLNKLRSVKTPEELSLIKAAQKLTDDTFDFILPRIEAGRTEREIMLDMEFFMRKNSSEGVAFDFIVVSGKNTSLPHGVPTQKRIEKGDFVTMDFGAVIGGYRSDMTRTVAVGNISDTHRAVYDTVLKAQIAAISEIRAGKLCRDIDKVAREITEREYPGLFAHGLGHSVGIEIHESPAFNTRDTSVLLPGTVMTVEPGIYLEGQFGVRIEDMVIVTETGCENITKSGKELIIL